MASELLIARRLPPGATTLAATDAGEAVVFSARRGAGAVIFSGALDAWRYRAASAPPSSFAEFWRRAIAEEATAVPPVLEVSADPSLIATGASTRVRARLRATELGSGADAIEVETIGARAVSPASHVDASVRLWPTAEPGVYEGEWRPSVPGDYNVTVSAGSRRGDVAIAVAAGISHGSAADPEGLALAARASGGRVFGAGQSAALVVERLGGWLSAGIPVVVWCRHDDYAARFDAHLPSVLTSGGVKVLRTAIWRLRQDSGGQDNPLEHVGRHITLLWDEVSRIPPDELQLRDPAQRG